MLISHKGKSMFGFKVFVSTLIVLMACLVTYSGFKAENRSGKMVSISIILIYGLSMIAIWG